MKPLVELPSHEERAAVSGSHEDAFLAAQRAARVGQYTCKRCSKTGALKDAVSLHYGGAVAFAMCTACFLEVDVFVTRGAEGIKIQTQPRSIIVVSG